MEWFDTSQLYNNLHIHVKIKCNMSQLYQTNPILFCYIAIHELTENKC
jgi:hypothetical protein